MHRSTSETEDLFTPSGEEALQETLCYLQEYKVAELKWTASAKCVLQDLGQALQYFRAGVKKDEALRKTTVGFSMATGAAILASAVATGGLLALAVGAAGVLGITSVVKTKQINQRSQALIKHVCSLAKHNRTPFVDQTRNLRKAIEKLTFLSKVAVTAEVSSGDCGFSDSQLNTVLTKMTECVEEKWFDDLDKFSKFIKTLQEKTDYVTGFIEIVSDLTENVQEFQRKLRRAGEWTLSV